MRISLRPKEAARDGGRELEGRRAAEGAASLEGRADGAEPPAPRHSSTHPNLAMKAGLPKTLKHRVQNSLAVDRAAASGDA